MKKEGAQKRLVDEVGRDDMPHLLSNGSYCGWLWQSMGIPRDSGFLWRMLSSPCKNETFSSRLGIFRAVNSCWD